MTTRRLLANLLLALAVLLLLEGACRLTERPSKYRESASLGYDLLPRYSARREHVNGAGVRGADIGPKAAGSFRILAMGGSTTWGHKVADDETWPAQLQARLRADGLPQAEIINGGVSGWDLEQVVIALRERFLQQFQPDLVLIHCGWNWPVLRDNANIARFLRLGSRSRRSDWLHRSALVRWLDRKLDKLSRSAVAANDEADAGADDAVFASRTGLPQAMAGSYPSLELQLAALCRERGAALAIVRYPALVQVPLPADAALRARYDEVLRTDGTPGVPLAQLDGAARTEYASALAVIDAASAAAGIPVLDAAARMLSALGGENAGARWLDCFKDRMHLTPTGNAALADALAELLREQGLLPAAR